MTDNIENVRDGQIAELAEGLLRDSDGIIQDTNKAFKKQKEDLMIFFSMEMGMLWFSNGGRPHSYGPDDDRAGTVTDLGEISGDVTLREFFGMYDGVWASARYGSLSGYRTYGKAFLPIVVRNASYVLYTVLEEHFERMSDAGYDVMQDVLLEVQDHFIDCTDMQKYFSLEEVFGDKYLDMPLSAFLKRGAPYVRSFGKTVEFHQKRGEKIYCDYKLYRQMPKILTVRHE